MYTVMPQQQKQQHQIQNFWRSSTSSCSEIDENDSDIGFEIKEDEQYNFMDDILKTDVQMQSSFSDVNDTFSSQYNKYDKLLQQNENNIETTNSSILPTIKLEVDERTMMHQQNAQHIIHQQQTQIQQNHMPQDFNMTSNNSQSSNNDGMDIYRDLILRHLVQDISTTCSKLYLPTNPYLWTVDHTNRWIIEMCQQFQLPTPTCQFNVTGEALLNMSQEEIMSRIPEGGDTIYAQLHLWNTAHESSQANKIDNQQQNCGLIHNHRTSSDSMSSNGWNSPTTPNKITETYSEYYDTNNESIQNMNAYYGMVHHQQQTVQHYPQQINQIHQQQQAPCSRSPNSYFLYNQQTMPSPSDSDVSSTSSCLQEEEEYIDNGYVHYGQQTQQRHQQQQQQSQQKQQQQCQVNPENGYCMPTQNSLAQAHLAAGNGVQNPSFTRNTGTVHLWHFIRELLDQPKQYSSCVRWVDREEGTFKIESSHHLARFWGLRKNRSQMNYDKLSRSLRQYYKKGIIQKPEKKQRLVYKFLHPYNL